MMSESKSGAWSRRRSLSFERDTVGVYSEGDSDSGPYLF